MPACPVGPEMRQPLSVPSVGLKLQWQAVRSHIMCHRGQKKRRPFASTKHRKETYSFQYYDTINMLDASWLSEGNTGQAFCKSLENGTRVIDMTPGDRQEIAALTEVREWERRLGMSHHRGNSQLPSGEWE